LGLKDYSILLGIIERPFGRTNSTEQLIEEYKSWLKCDKSSRNGTLICLVGDKGCGENLYWIHLFQYILVNGFCASKLIIYIVSVKRSMKDSFVPYLGFCSVLDQLVNMILSETNDLLSNWETKLIEHVGIERLMIFSILVPSISHIVSSLKDIKTDDYLNVGSTEIYNSIELFLELFSSYEVPLVIYLDDLEVSINLI
jgi:predicted ATPase